MVRQGGLHCQSLLTGEKMPFKKKIINLALQGGGSHGAFTWGVLDYLLEEASYA